MLSYSKIRLPLLSCLMLLVGLSLSTAPALADGNVLRSFDVPIILPARQAIYWPIGVTFDGTNLYYSQPAVSPKDIFHITTTGTLLNTLSALNQAGALAWDGNHLWVGVYSSSPTNCTPGVSGCALIYEVDPSTDSITNTVDISAVFATDQECNIIDGLSYDPSSGSFWVSPDPGCLFGVGIDGCSIGYAYNVDTSGNLLRRLVFPFGVSGVASAGHFVYIVDRCGTGSVSIDKTTLSGSVVSSFPIAQVDPRSWAESIAFDPVTFAPSCALWTMQPYSVSSPQLTFPADIVAYQVGCH